MHKIELLIWIFESMCTTLKYEFCVHKCIYIIHKWLKKPLWVDECTSFSIYNLILYFRTLSNVILTLEVSHCSHTIKLFDVNFTHLNHLGKAKMANRRLVASQLERLGHTPKLSFTVGRKRYWNNLYKKNTRLDYDEKLQLLVGINNNNLR